MFLFQAGAAPWATFLVSRAFCNWVAAGAPAVDAVLLLPVLLFCRMAGRVRVLSERAMIPGKGEKLTEV